MKSQMKSIFIVTVTCVLLLFEFVGIKTGCKKQYSITFTDWYIYNKHLNKIKSGLWLGYLLVR